MVSFFCISRRSQSLGHAVQEWASQAGVAGLVDLHGECPEQCDESRSGLDKKKRMAGTNPACVNPGPGDWHIASLVAETMAKTSPDSTTWLGNFI
jgi:hypothetical protein